MNLPDPAKLALELLDRAGLASPPVRLESISALWPNLTVSTEDLDCEGYIIDVGNLGAEIVVRSDDVLPRRRYSIAHELGHWMLRLEGYANKTYPEPSHAVLERWCDRFAASLLMPQDWVVRDLRSVRLAHLADAVLNLPADYEVSHSAFRLRVSELTPVSVFECKRSATGTVLIEKRYEASGVSKRDLAATLRRVSTLLCEEIVPANYFHEDTRLLSLHRLCRSKSNTRVWLICILPRTKVTSEIRSLSLTGDTQLTT